MLNRKFSEQIVTNRGAISTAHGTSPISKRIRKVSAYNPAQEKFLRIIVGIGVLISAPIMYAFVRIAQNGALMEVVHKATLAVSAGF